MRIPWRDNETYKCNPRQEDLREDEKRFPSQRLSDAQINLELESNIYSESECGLSLEATSEDWDHHLLSLGRTKVEEGNISRESGVGTLFLETRSLRILP